MLQTIGSRRALHGDAGESCRSGSNTAGMLPVSIGPNRCELISNHDKQPLLELSLRICLPIKELLSTLSQVAPPANKQTNRPLRLVAKTSPTEEKRRDLDTPAQGQQPARASNWQPSYHPWEQSLQPQWEKYPVTSAAWHLLPNPNRLLQLQSDQNKRFDSCCARKATKVPATTEEHRPPPRPRAHPKKCPVQ